MSYKIIMDVSGDVIPEFVAEKDISFIPMHYTIGGETRCCTNIESAETMKKFYDGQRNGDLTQTSQINPYLYEENLRPYFEAGQDILYLCLSSGLSSTFQSANVAKASLEEEFPDRKLYPLDTLSATGGMGVLVERAVRNKEAGMSIEENFEDLSAAVPSLHHWFFVQDLMYLKRGGRIGAATAVVGTMLNVRPLLLIDEIGKLITFDKKRGNKAAAKALLDNFARTYDENGEDAVYVIDADAPNQGAYLAAEVAKIAPNAKIRRVTLGPVIGAHTGPGMAAITHMGKVDRNGK